MTSSAARQRIRWQTVGLRLLAALILAGSIGAIIYASVAETFFVYEAQIVGSHYIDTDTIYQAARVHEQNIFWIQPDKVMERITELDGIKDARVHHDLPAQVLIEVEERKPVVMWRAQTQGRDWWLDEDGIVLTYPGVVSNTVFVVDSSERQLMPGDHIGPDGIVQSVLQLATALPEIRVFFYQADRGLSFVQKTARGEWPVYIGDSRDLPHKVQVLQALTAYMVKHRIRPRYVDVRWADYPVYGKRGAQATKGGE